MIRESRITDQQREALLSLPCVKRFGDGAIHSISNLHTIVESINQISPVFRKARELGLTPLYWRDLDGYGEQWYCLAEDKEEVRQEEKKPVVKVWKDNFFEKILSKWNDIEGMWGMLKSVDNMLQAQDPNNPEVSNPLYWHYHDLMWLCLKRVCVLSDRGKREVLGEHLDRLGYGLMVS